MQQFTAIKTLCYDVERNDIQQYPIYPIIYYCLFISLKIVQMERGDYQTYLSIIWYVYIDLY